MVRHRVWLATEAWVDEQEAGNVWEELAEEGGIVCVCRGAEGAVCEAGRVNERETGYVNDGGFS